jgi:L-ascorbate metabolism protein UlaG (beta-lactamase superfamily)
MSAFDRRSFLRTATAGTALAPLLGAASVRTAAPAAAAPTRHGATAEFRWLGTSGWRVDIGEHTVLVDPYLSRFDTGMFGEDGFKPGTELKVDATAIADNVGDPDVVLVTHGHWDHFNDVPHIATTTGARVIGTPTVVNLAAAMDVKSDQLSHVRGGEVLDFGAYTVEVVASLHSRNKSHSIALSGWHLTPPARRPATVADLPEGDTLAFQLTVKGGPSVFFMGGSDFAERNVAGLKPDVAMIALPSTSATHDYVPRLIRALDKPRTVVPVHWDNFEVALENPPVDATGDAMGPDEFAEIVRKAAPRTEVVRPEYLTPYHFG